MTQADVQQRLETLAKLQTEAKEKEGVVFAMYGGLLAFSSATLLALLTITPHGYLTTGACCALLASCLSYGSIVLSRVHLLHKASALHIGHIIIAEDLSNPANTVGLVSLSIGIGLFVWHISFFCALFFAIGLGFAIRAQAQFKKKFDAMPSAKEALVATATQTPAMHERPQSH